MHRQNATLGEQRNRQSGYSLIQQKGDHSMAETSSATLADP